MFEIQPPIEMLTYGIREFIKEKARCRVFGSAQRRNTEYGQCIYIRAVGYVQDLLDFEEECLKYNGSKGRMWNYKRQGVDERTEEQSCAIRDFIILSSTHGADKGYNSNPEYDHKSIMSKRSQISSVGEKRSQKSKSSK